MASPYTRIEGMQHISEVVRQANKELTDLKTGAKRPFKTFLRKLNNKIGGIYPGDQIVIAGRSGVGKSAFVTSLIKHLAEDYKDDKLLFLYWSFEMKSWRNIVRMYSQQVGKTVKELLSANAPLSDSVYAQLLDAGNEYKDMLMYFRDIPVNEAEWEQAILNIQAQFPEYTIINMVDHTRLLSSNNEKTEEEKITKLMLKGIKLKNTISCINIFLSQLNRKVEDGERRDVGTTGLLPTYIFGADSVMQCADVVLGLHRPETYDVKLYKQVPTKDLLVCQIMKQREGEICELALFHNLAINLILDENPNPPPPHPVLSA